MQQLDPIIFNYRFDDESGDVPYQLVISRTGNAADNGAFFLKFYQLLQTLLKSEREQIYFNDLVPVIEYHYWKFTPKFAFVNELAKLYEQSKNAGKLSSAQINQFLEYWIEQKRTNSSIYEDTIRLSTVADEATATRMQIPIGTPYTYIPEALTDLEAFQRLKFMLGPQVCEYHVKEFEQKYKEPTAEIYASELAPINSFIDNIDYSEVKTAFEKCDNNQAREYLRIVHGYYENHRVEQAMGNNASMVYGKYILYKKWLEDRLRESFSNKSPRGLPQLEPGKVSSDFVLGQELFNVLFQRGLLSDFFQVPAPPVKGRFWYDINDKETDDPAFVVRVSPISIKQKRRANVDDFQIVLGQVNIIKNKESKAHRHFIDDLIACVKQMIDLHRNLHKPQERDEEHYELIELAEQFIAWLKPKKTNSDRLPLSSVFVNTPNSTSKNDIQILDNLTQRTDDLPDILHLRAAEWGYQLTDEDRELLMDTYSKLDDILKEVAAFINIRFPGCERHVRAWNNIDFDTKIGDFKVVTNDREHIKREWRKGIFDLKSLIKVLRNETVLLVDGKHINNVNNIYDISSDHKLDHYTNKEVIANQKLVNEVIFFFENGPGKKIFYPLEILNLIDKQKTFILYNFNNGDLVLQTLKDLPLSDRARHSLLGFLLKWFGGYPVNNMNEEFNETLKLIQTEFLSFEGDTPEKQYCRADQAMRNKFEKYGIAFTTAINHGIDVSELLAAMDDEVSEETVYHNFPELFTAATKAGLVEGHTDRKNFLIAQSACNYQFNVWLQEHKNWEYRNDGQYEELLTFPVFQEFLDSKATAPSNIPLDGEEAEQPEISHPESVKLSIRQIALICQYTDCHVTRANANGIVVQYGHTSGDSLFNDYSHYRSRANRVGAESTKKKNANKLALFESVQVHLINDQAASAKIGAELVSLREAIDEANLTL